MKPSARSRLLLALLGLALAEAPVLRAQTAAELPKKEITEKTSAGFAKLKTLVDAKDYPAALAHLDSLLAAAPAGGYDVCLLSQIKARILLAENKLPEAVVPLEAARRLAAANPNFFDDASDLEQLQLLAQIHYQIGADQKVPADQRASYEKALGYINLCLERSPKPAADIRLFASSLLYSLATLTTGKPDAKLLRDALRQAEEAALLAPAPGVQTRMLAVACHLQLGENARAAELLELVAARDPKNASVWSQLQAVYLGLAAGAKEPAEIRSWNLRALHALDRAQAAGLLLSPKDNYTRVALLFNLRQFGRAAERLEAGLADGGLESSRRNWELLASAYQQTHQDPRALDALGRAVKIFPDDGPLEFSLAQLLYGAGRVEEAYARGRSALAKPGVERPGQVRLYLAFLAYELQRFEEAAAHAAEARRSGEAPASSLDPLERAIADALKTREAARS